MAGKSVIISEADDKSVKKNISTLEMLPRHCRDQDARLAMSVS